MAETNILDLPIQKLPEEVRLNITDITLKYSNRNDEVTPDNKEMDNGVITQYSTHYETEGTLRQWHRSISSKRYQRVGLHYALLDIVDTVFDTTLINLIDSNQRSIFKHTKTTIQFLGKTFTLTENDQKCAIAILTDRPQSLEFKITNNKPDQFPVITMTVSIVFPPTQGGKYNRKTKSTTKPKTTKAKTKARTTSKPKKKVSHVKK
jgi:hypothetical protein